MKGIMITDEYMFFDPNEPFLIDYMTSVEDILMLESCGFILAFRFNRDETSVILIDSLNRDFKDELLFEDIESFHKKIYNKREVFKCKKHNVRVQKIIRHKRYI